MFIILVNGKMVILLLLMVYVDVNMVSEEKRMDFIIVVLINGIEIVKSIK